MSSFDSVQRGRHLMLERNKTSLNGRVAMETDVCSSGDASPDADIKYEYMYSMDDDNGEEGIRYMFDAYPVDDGKRMESLAKKEPRMASNKDAPLSLGATVDNYIPDNNPIEDDSQHEIVKPHSKGHVSFCDLGDIADQVARSKRPTLTRSKTDCTTMLLLKPPICSIQERQAIAGDKQIRREKSELIPGKYANTTKKIIPWQERLKLAIKRQVKPSNTPTKATGNFKRRQSVTFDPDLEKSSAYIHGGNHNFSRAKTSLTPVRSGLKHLQMNYTETNLEANQSIIFLDLLKTSHQQSRLRGTSISNIERRLAVKRDNAFYATSFYENKNIPDPHRRQEMKNARSMVQKQYERQEKIRKTTDELHIGYKRTFLTIKTPSREEVEDIGTNCRYLRCIKPGNTSYTNSGVNSQ